MNKTQLMIASAMVAAFSLPILAGAQAGPAPSPKFEHEKCFGIAKAGDAWIYVPKGTCARVVDGALQAKK